MSALTFRRAATMLVVLIALAGDLRAQQVPSPPGAIGGLFGGRRPQVDPNRARSRWTVTFNGSGGVDEEPVERLPEDPRGRSVSGAVGTIAANTQFSRGRLIDASGGGFFSRRELQAGQMRGAHARVLSQFGPNERLNFAASASLNFQPIAVGIPVSIPHPDDNAAPPESLGPPPGVDEQLWISSIATAMVRRGWTPRQRLELNYWDFRSQPVDSPGYYMQSRRVSIGEVWDATERLELRAGYNNSRTRRDTATGGLPTTIQSLTGGFDLERRLGRTRSMTFAVDAGADLAESSTGQGPTTRSAMPTVSASMQLTLSQGWTLTVGGGHEATVLTGVTSAPFTTDHALLQIGGTLLDRLSVAVSGSYSRGTMLESQEESYEAGAVTAQFSYGLSRSWAFFGTVSYYDHWLQEVEESAGIPPAYRRRSARVGFSYWLPLYGTF